MSIDEKIANTENLTKALRAAAELYGTNSVEFWKDKNGNYTNSRTLAELEDLALKFGTSLIGAGVEEGNIVSVLMECNEDFLVAEQGILASGATIGSLYTDDSPETLVDKINEMESSVLIVDKAIFFYGYGFCFGVEIKALPLQNNILLIIFEG